MIRMSLIALALAITSGCAMDAPDDTDTDTAEAAITISPIAGTWTYGELTPVSGNCSTSLAQGESGPFIVDTVTSTSFRVVPNDGTVPFTCSSLANQKFGCPNRAIVVQDLRPTLDAVVTVRVTATGTFSDGSHALGKQDAAVSCVGTQCSQLGTMPCGFVDNFSVHR